MTSFNAAESGCQPLITILWAIYRYIYHLGYDNMNTFMNDAADKPFASLMACELLKNVSVWSSLSCWMSQSLQSI